MASFYSQSGELLFTNAGHMPPLWYRAAAQEWSFLFDSTPLSKEIVDLPLGMIPGTAYLQTAVQLDPGDLLLLYTDGISESWDESGEQLGLAGLLRIARNLPTESVVAAGKELLAAVAQFRGAAPPADDETVVVLRRNPRERGWRERNWRQEIIEAPPNLQAPVLIYRQSPTRPAFRTSGMYSSFRSWMAGPRRFSAQMAADGSRWHTFEEMTESCNSG